MEETTNQAQTNPEEQELAGRNQDGTFAKGVSGNPNGRPKGISITEMVKAALEEVEPKSGKTWKVVVVEKILTKATNEGDTNLLKAIWAYIDGMPVQSTDITSNGEKINIFFHPSLKQDAGLLPLSTTQESN
jgi:hypothetical protein